jgi:transcriptional regulator with XRE-family HTH domain
MTLADEPDSPPPGSFAERLRLLREKRGLRLADLEEKTGVSRGFLSELERGKKTPTLDTLKKIASGLQVSIQDLVGEEEHPADTSAPGEDLPPGLREFVADMEAKGTPIPKDHVAMLLGIHPRRQTLATAEDYATVYHVIRKVFE